MCLTCCARSLGPSKRPKSTGVVQVLQSNMPVRLRTLVTLATCVWAASFACGCSRTSRLPSDVYVWNRSWTAAVQRSVREAAPEVGALRVLLDETGPTAAEVAVDFQALENSKKPVIAVLRAGAAMPTEADLQRLMGRVIALRTRNIAVEQIEFDYDAPTQALSSWVERLRTFKAPGLRVSVTALPAWASSPHAAALANAVDEVVLQVHTVRAPTLFDADEALADARRWAEASSRPFRVALPAYRVTLGDGQHLAADPTDVSSAMRALERLPAVTGFVFFRLGNSDDRSAWSPATLTAVLQRQPLAPARVEVQLEPHQLGRDVWLVNPSRFDGQAPETFLISGAIAHAEATTGYEQVSARFTTGQPMWLRPGERIRIGTVRGENLYVLP